HPQDVSVVAFSPDGRRLTTGAGDGTPKVWHAADGESVRIPAHPAAVYSLCFSPDGRRLASAGRDRAVKVCDVGEAGARAAAALTPRQLQALWDDLAGADAAKAYRAIWALAAAAEQAVPFFEKHLRPAPKLSPRQQERLSRLLRDMED